MSRVAQRPPGAAFRIAVATWTTIGACALVGCATPADDAPGDHVHGGFSWERDESRLAADAFERLVATDLVAVMMQLPSRSPFGTTVQLAPSRSDYGIALGEALRGGGYGIQRVPDDQGQFHVRYGAVRAEDERGPLTTYALAIGDVALERDYRDARDTMVPSSAVRVLGSPPVRVIVNDDVHRRRGVAATFVSGVIFLADDGSVLERRERQVRMSEASARAAGARVETERFLVLARANLFLGDRLAAEPEPVGVRTPIRQVRMRFADAAALRLGEPNKRALARMIELYRGATDRFSVTGCSHGDSLLWDGTESDALARSQRVKEELVRGGVPSGRVREEGCFDTRYGATLGPGAVVVTLERRTWGRTEGRIDARADGPAGRRLTDRGT